MTVHRVSRPDEGGGGSIGNTGGSGADFLIQGERLKDKSVSCSDLWLESSHVPQHVTYNTHAGTIPDPHSNS